VVDAVNRTVGASVGGSSHVEAGRGCDDAHAWVIEESYSVFAIADGAGSARQSAIGSYLAVNAAVRVYGGAEPTSQGMLDGFHGIREEIREFATDNGLDLNSFATTIAVLVVTSDSVSLGQIGDSLCFFRSPDGSIWSAKQEEKGEYVNHTQFITGEFDDDYRFEQYPVSDVTGAVLSTDGLRYKILEDLGSGSPYTPFFEDIFGYVEGSPSSPQLGEFLESLEDDQTGDDKTLVVVTNGGVLNSSQASAEPALVEEDDLQEVSSDIDIEDQGELQESSEDE